MIHRTGDLETRKLQKRCLTCNGKSKFTTTCRATTQWAFTCSKLTIETLEQGVKYVQS